MNQTEVKRRQAEAVAEILTLAAVSVLGRMIGNNGIVYMAVAVEAYALLWNGLSGSLSDTLGRLLRSRRNKGQYKKIAAMRRNVMIFQAILGLAGTLFLMISARGIARTIFRIPQGELIIMVISPVIFFRSVSAVLLGYFQGEGSELPRAVTGILRVVFTFGFGILFSSLLGNYGEKVSGLLREENYAAMYRGVGIAVALGLAEFLVVLFLTVIFKLSRNAEEMLRRQERTYSTESLFDSIRSVYVSRWPQILTGVLGCLPMGLGLLFFARVEDEAVSAADYGLYAGTYLVVCGIAVCLISLPALPVMAKIFMCLRNGEARFARRVFQSGVHISIVHGIFLTIYIAFMGGQFAGFLRPDNSETVQKMLTGGSSAILFTALSAYFCRFLQTAGKKYLVLGAAGISVLVFAFSTAIIFNPGRVGILSLVYGGMMGLFVLCVLSGMLAYRQMRVQIDWLNVLIVPSGAGVGSGIICLLMGKAFSAMLGNPAALLICLVLAGGVYWAALLLLHNFKEQELEVIPGGKLLGTLGQNFGWDRR